VNIKVSRQSLVVALRDLTLTNKTLMIESSESLVITLFDDYTVVQTAIKDVEVNRPGAIVIQANTFFEIIEKLRNDEVYIDSANESVKIRNGQTQLEVSTLDSSIYCREVCPPDESLFSLSGKTLKSFFRAVAHAIDKDSTNVATTGIRLKSEDGYLSATGCNTKQIAYITTEIHDSPEFEILLSADHAKLLQGYIHDGDIHFSIKGNDAIFVAGSHIFYMRLLDAQYPPIDKLLEKDVSSSATVLVDDLVKSVDLSTIAAHRAKGGIVEILVKLNGNDSLAIMSKSQLGKIMDTVSVDESHGEGVAVVCDARFLRNAAKAAGMERVCIGFVGHEAPIIIDFQNGHEKGKFIIQARRKGREWDGI